MDMQQTLGSSTAWPFEGSQSLPRLCCNQNSNQTYIDKYDCLNPWNSVIDAFSLHL